MNNPIGTGLGKATINDVAKLAGVSIKTVSRVTNGLPNVRVPTRERVQRAIDALQYQPNPYARYLGSLRGSGKGNAQTLSSPVGQGAGGLPVKTD